MKLYKPFHGSYPTSQAFGGNATYYAQFGQKGHNGIDYAIPSGTPVRAAADGVVDFEGWGKNEPLAGVPAGIYVLLEHSQGWTGYAHLNRTIVDKGQKVTRGQVIAYSGASGTVTGAHLHFERFPDNYNLKNGYYGRINPQPELNLSAPPPPAPVDPCKAVKAELVKTRSQLAGANETIKVHETTIAQQNTAIEALEAQVIMLEKDMEGLEQENDELIQKLQDCENKECPPTECDCSTFWKAVQCWLSNKEKK